MVRGLIRASCRGPEARHAKIAADRVLGTVWVWPKGPTFLGRVSCRHSSQRLVSHATRLYLWCESGPGGLRALRLPPDSSLLHSGNFEQCVAPQPAVVFDADRVRGSHGCCPSSCWSGLDRSGPVGRTESGQALVGEPPASQTGLVQRALQRVGVAVRGVGRARHVVDLGRAGGQRLLVEDRDRVGVDLLVPALLLRIVHGLYGGELAVRDGDLDL